MGGEDEPYWETASDDEADYDGDESDVEADEGGDSGVDADEVIEKIEAVEIQGATSIAREGVRLLQRLDREGVGEARVDDVAERLKGARPTEPFLYNCIRVSRETGEYEDVLEHIEGSQEDIVDYGVDLVEDGDVVYTHCHSSSVTGVLEEVDLELSVRVTETRPLYQGRTTAEEMAEAGVPVRFYVDSGARLALKDADVMLIGADAVLDSGKVVNKIGSEMFAEVADRYGVPVYVVTDSWKYDPLSSFGFEPEIERRAAEEVWKDPPDDVEIYNYAFEKVAPGKVEGVVSELGVHPPEEFIDRVVEEYPELLEAVESGG